MSYFDDTADKVEKARRTLEEMKDFESSTPMFTWKQGNVEIAYNSIESLHNAVERLGYEWETGTMTKAEKQ